MLTFYDVILTPIYFILILAWLIRWKKKHYKDSPLAKYIIPCFLIKVACCIFLACLYGFYYQFSDSEGYFNGAQDIWNATKQNPWMGIDMIFSKVDNFNLAQQKFTDHIGSDQHIDSTIYIMKITAFFCLFCFGSYMPIALLFSLLAFLGTWRILLIFHEEYPGYTKPLAMGCLFAPSAILWGTNVLKDPLCMYGLGLCVTTLYAFMKGRTKPVNIIELVIGSILLLAIKNYIFFIFVASAGVTILTLYKTRHKLVNYAFRTLTIIGVLISCVWMYLNIGAIGDAIYENFTSYAEAVQIFQASQIETGASGYILMGLRDFSFLGIIRSYIISLNVALFRPYLWEVRNPLMLMNALESVAVLLLTAYLLIRTKIKGFFTFAMQTPILFFGLLFSLMLAPLAGFISFNFGTLVRYKYPMVPFFYTYLLLLYSQLKHKKKGNP